MKRALKWSLRCLILITLCLTKASWAEQMKDHTVHPYIYHLVQAELWDQALQTNEAYFPPTYDQDGFTHATANPDKLLSVANHFYKPVPGEWYCLRMTVASLESSGVRTIFEGTAPVGDIEPEFTGSDDELFPHVLGGIFPKAVIESFPVTRADDGTFLKIIGVTHKEL